MLEKDKILRVLSEIKYPPYDRDIVSFGMVKYVKAEGSRAQVRIFAGADSERAREVVKKASELLASSFPGCEFDVELLKEDPSSAPVSVNENLLRNVRWKIAVASGKGGVGKSTVAVNLARALARKFSADTPRVGLMDCDVYGPSATILFGKKEFPAVDENRKIIPPQIDGIKVISMGMLVDDDQPLIWRGPMVSSALKQFAEDVDWGDLDAMVMDFPPGTGDAVLSMVQTVPISGALIVTTPNSLAAQTAARGAMLFGKSNVKILGLVENMAYFQMPDGSKEFVFGEGYADGAAAHLGIPVLARIPIDKSLYSSVPSESVSAAFDALADEVLKALEGSEGVRG